MFSSHRKSQLLQMHTHIPQLSTWTGSTALDSFNVNYTHIFSQFLLVHKGPDVGINRKWNFRFCEIYKELRSSLHNYTRAVIKSSERRGKGERERTIYQTRLRLLSSHWLCGNLFFISSSYFQSLYCFALRFSNVPCLQVQWSGELMNAKN